MSGCSYYQAGAVAHIEGTALEVKDPGGRLLQAYALKALAKDLIEGQPTTRGERAAAGAAILTLLGQPLPCTTPR